MNIRVCAQRLTVKGGREATLEDDHFASEHRHEVWRLLPLHHADLHRTPLQPVVELHRLGRRRARFVLAGVAALRQGREEGSALYRFVKT